MTQTLAIIGAVTGITGAVLGLFSYFRDRAKLEVTHYEQGGPGREDSVIVFVSNQGRQPIAITEAGLMQIQKISVMLLAVRSVLRLFLSLLFRIGVSKDRLGHWLDWLDSHIVPMSDTGPQSWNVIEEPVLLGLGVLKEYEVSSPLAELTSEARGIPIYAYARDSRGRIVLGLTGVDFSGLDTGGIDPDEQERVPLKSGLRVK